MASTITVSEEVSKKESLLSLAGAWSDMSDSEEEELVKGIRRAGENGITLFSTTRSHLLRSR